MSTAPRPQKLNTEYNVLEVKNAHELRERLNDQSAHGWQFVQAVPRIQGFVVIFSKETPFAIGNRVPPPGFVDPTRPPG